MRRLIPHILLLFLLAFGLSRTIATERERITPENIDRLTEIASIGRGAVEQLRFTPDGEHIIVSTAEGADIYSSHDLSADPHFLATNAALEYEVTSDSRYLVGWEPPQFVVPKNRENPFWVWDLQTFDLVVSTQTLFPNDGDWPKDIFEVIVVPDSSRLLMSDARNKLYEWDFEEPDLVRTIPVIWQATFSSENSSAASPDGRLLGRCFRGGLVQVVDIASGETISTFQVVDAETVAWRSACLTYNEESSELIALFEHNRNVSDYVAVGWSMIENAALYKQRLPSSSVVGFDRNGSPIVMTSTRLSQTERTFEVQLVELGTEIIRWSATSDEDFDSGVFNANRDVYLARKFGPDSVGLSSWDIANGQQLWSTHLSLTAFYDMSRDRNMVVVGEAISGDIQGWNMHDTAIYVFDLATGEQQTATLEHTHSIFDPVFSPDSHYLVMGDKDNGLRMVDTYTWEMVNLLDPTVGRWPRVQYDRVHFTGRYTVTSSMSSSNGLVQVTSWNVETGEHVGSPFPNQYSLINWVAHPNGVVAVGVEQRSANPDTCRVYVIDQAHETVLFQLDTDYRVDQIALSSDESIVVVPTSDGQIRVFDTDTFEIIYMLQAHRVLDHRYDFADLVIAPNNPWFGITYYDGITEIWNLADGSFWGDTYGVEFSPNGRYITAIERETYTLRFYDQDSGEAMSDRPTIENVADMDFSPDSRLLAIQTHGEVDYYGDPIEAEIWIYDLVTGEQIAQINDHPVLTNPQFSPDGTMLMAQAADRRLIVYGIE